MRCMNERVSVGNSIDSREPSSLRRERDYEIKKEKKEKANESKIGRRTVTFAQFMIAALNVHYSEYLSSAVVRYWKSLSFSK